MQKTPERGDAYRKLMCETIPDIMRDLHDDYILKFARLFKETLSSRSKLSEKELNLEHRFTQTDPVSYLPSPIP